MATTKEKRSRMFMNFQNRIHNYFGGTGETLAKIVANDYFKDCRLGLQTGDIILVQGTDSTSFYKVTALSPALTMAKVTIA